MNDKKLLQQISSCRSALREQAQIAFESRQPIELSTNESISVIEDLHKNEEKQIKAKNTKKKNDVKTIPSHCNCFYALIKPEKSNIGKRDFFFYTKDLKMIYDPEIKRVEVLPDNAQIYIEGRFLMISDNGVSRKFSLKVKRQILNNILETHYPTTLRPFFLSYLACNMLPPITNATVGFLTRSVLTTEFFVSFIDIPSELIDDTIVGKWIFACENKFVTIFEKTYREFLSRQESPTFDIPESSFISKVMDHIFIKDDVLTAFLPKFCRETDNIYDKYCNALKEMPFNERTKMALFIIAKETTAVFGHNYALVTLSKIIFNCGINPYLVKERSPNSEKLYDLVYVTSTLEAHYAETMLYNLSRYYRQPRNYTPTKTNFEIYGVYESLINVMVNESVEYLVVLKHIEEKLQIQ